MPSLVPIGGAIRINPSSGGAATTVPLADGGFAVVYRIANGPDVFRLFDSNYQPTSDEITVTSGDQLAPQATALNDGRFVVAWLTQDQTIQAQIYNPDGSASGGPVTIVTPTDPIYGVSDPKLVGNAFGGFTAIWQDNATINGVTGPVFIQSYDGNASPVGDPIEVVPPTGSATDQTSIADFRIAVLGDGTTVAAAMVQINGIDFIMYSVNGGPLTSLAGGDPNFVYINPQITPLAGGGYVITYDFVDPTLVGTDSPDANWTTGGSVFTSHGTRHDFAVGTTVTTSSTGTFAVDPSVITALADGGFVVTFEPLKSPLGDGYLVDAQQFDAFGNGVGPVVLVAPQGFLPSVATSANGVVLDTYQFGSGIFLQAFNSAPTPLGPEPEGTSFGLNSVVSANSPGVAPLSTGGFVVVYQDANAESRAQIYGFDRKPVGNPFVIAQHGAQPVVASQANGTFLVAWSTGTQIMGAVYDNQGNLQNGPFSMSGDPSSQPVLAPAINPTTTGGYAMAYETDLQDGGSHLVTVQVFDGTGNAIGSAVSQTYAPTNPLAPPRIAALEAQLFGSVTVIGMGTAIFAAIVSDPLTGGGNAGVAGQPFTVTSHASVAPTTNVIQVSGANDGAARAGAQVATIANGDIVTVWNEAPANSETWEIVGQLLTPAGVFVGGQFTIGTALPSNAPAAQIALSALPDGGFLVTYDSGNTTLASERFDHAGHAMGPPTVMSGSGQAGVVTTVLSDGNLLLISSDTSGGTVTAETFQFPSTPMNWTGTASTDLGTAANWDVQIPPDNSHVMQFGLANGGTLTGQASAVSATFTGKGPWVVSGGTIALLSGITDQSALQIADGSLTGGTGGGGASIGAVGGAAAAVSGAAQVSFRNTMIGAGAGQTGTLTLTGTGTGWTDTGAAGSGGLQVGTGTGAGSVTVTQGAHLTSSDVDVFGATAGSEGDLSVSSGGVMSDAGLILGEAGAGIATVNGGTITGTGSLVIGQSAGAQGALTVSGTNGAVTGSGPMLVGDAGLGALGIQSGGSVLVGPATVGGISGLVIANTTSASGSSINVTGIGSNLQIGGSLIVGNAGFGQLSVAQGATVGAIGLTEGAAAGGSGVVSVAGTGSGLNLTGALNVGGVAPGELSILNGGEVTAASVTIGAGAGGIGNLVIGTGGTLTLTGTTAPVVVGPGAAAVLNIQGGTLVLAGGSPTFGPNGRLVQVGGKIDPAQTLTVAGNAFGGGAIDEASVEVLNTATAISKAPDISGGSATFLAPLVTGGSASKPGIWNIDGNGTVGQGGTLVLDVNTVAATQEFTFADNTGVLEIGQQVTVDGGGTPHTINAATLPGFLGSIDSYVTGDQIIVDTTAAAGFGYVGGGTTITVNDLVAGLAVGTQEGVLTFTDPAAAAQAFADRTNATASLADQVLACFAAGTRIATVDGLLSVESIHPGMRVCTVLGGDTAEVIWTGYRKVNCARHADPTKVWPVVVSAHAFGRGMPATDLTLSPDHAVYVDNVLIPIRLLVNGRTVRQVLTDRITYHHIELARHDILLANGMPAESYLDAGDRARFSNGGNVITLYPDFSARAWEMNGCAPLVQTGPVLAAVRKRLGAEVARRKRSMRGSFAPESTFPIR